jgi:hypothetical protein
MTHMAAILETAPPPKVEEFRLDVACAEKRRVTSRALAALGRGSADAAGDEPPSCRPEIPQAFTPGRSFLRPAS